MCGEKKLAQFEDETGEGSPPHVRGKVLAAGLHDLADRITPACAGKSRAIASCSLSIRDHPRMCGEKFHLMT